MKFDLALSLSICCGGVFAGVLYTLVSVRLLGLLQQFGYENVPFLRWYFAKGNIQRKRLSLLALSLVLLTALFVLVFSFLPTWGANLTALAPFGGVCALYLFSEKKYALKVPARRTARYLRLLSSTAVLASALSVGVGFAFAAACLAADLPWLSLFRFVPIAAVPLLLPLVAVCANALMRLYETPHNRRFVRRAAGRLAAANCVKVGITGSFGKTSVKHYAEQLLSEKFRVIATPASYNTPMGIARTVKELGTDCDIFLAEMGARHAGDISALCDLVQPTVGAVVGICPQHIETFGSLEAIEREKGVLAARTERCVLGRSARSLRADAVKEGEDFAAENIVLTAEGSKFDLRLGGERVPVETRLLGRHAAEDVAVAAALCHALGMTVGEIAARIPALTPVPHRLQRLEAGGLTIFDDAYNSNIEGAKNALEVLSLSGGRQVVVTPGLVELGALEEEKNGELGAALKGFDVILVGETLILSVRKGYLDAGGDEARLTIVPTLSAAKELLASRLEAGDSVLFLNDLPDKYR